MLALAEERNLITESIILQQLKLEFGNNFDDLYANTRSFVKSLISRNWWKDKNILLQSEGPLSLMVEQCLVHVFEHQDKVSGFKAYTSYLTGLYGSTNSAANHVPYDAVDIADKHIAWSTVGDWATSSPFGLPSETTSTEHLVEHVIPDWISLEQAEFMETYARTGPQVTAELLGMDKQKVRDRQRTIRQKVRRHASS